MYSPSPSTTKKKISGYTKGECKISIYGSSYTHGQEGATSTSLKSSGFYEFLFNTQF